MKVEDWPIDKVTPYEKNPRNNDGAVGATANSIKEFGPQQPSLFCCHQRWREVVVHTRGRRLEPS